MLWLTLTTAGIVNPQHRGEEEQRILVPINQHLLLQHRDIIRKHRLIESFLSLEVLLVLIVIFIVLAHLTKLTKRCLNPL